MPSISSLSRSSHHMLVIFNCPSAIKMLASDLFLQNIDQYCMREHGAIPRQVAAILQQNFTFIVSSCLQLLGWLGCESKNGLALSCIFIYYTRTCLKTMKKLHSNLQPVSRQGVF